MADTTLEGKYFFKKTLDGTWKDITTEYAGVKVLKVDGFNELGDAVNTYNEQWFSSDVEDFCIVGDSIIRKNVDLSMTLIISRRYTSSAMDEETVYNTLVSDLLSSDFYIYSSYTRKKAHVVCMKSFKPTTTDLHRGDKSYILVTIPLHTLSVPDEPYGQIGSYS